MKPKPKAKAKVSRVKAAPKKVSEDTINGTSSEAIAAQIKDFLSKGNKIKEIPIGTTGITHTGGTKHITISRNKG